MAFDLTDPATAAIIGVCVALGACVIILAVFFLINWFTKAGKIHLDSNVRRRIIKEESAPIIYKEQPADVVPEPVQPLPPPQPIIYPEPMYIAPGMRLPRRQLIERPRPMPPPPPPMPMRRVLPPPMPVRRQNVITEVIHRYEVNEPTPAAPVVSTAPAVAPAPQLPQPTQMSAVGRRKSWAGTQDLEEPKEEDWVLVKRVTKSKEKEYLDDRDCHCDDSSDDDDDRGHRRKQKKSKSRLAAYDLAVPAFPQSSGFYTSGQPTRIMMPRL